nr:unnamed protein product [Callosobruchus chinensis]
MSAHKLFPHLTSYSYVRCFQRPGTFCNFMDRILLLSQCVNELKRVLQLLNYPDLQ